MRADPALHIDTQDAAPTNEVISDRHAAGLTVREVARRYRVGEDKVRA
jgi:hypothetical protein